MRNLRPIDVTLIWTCLGDDAAGHLTEYFHSGMYSGAHFERFAGGGDRKATADQFTSDDIVAVSMLSVRIPGKAALALLQRDPDKVNALLAAIPQEVDLWNVDEAAIAPGSPADQLWTALEATPGIGWVTANNSSHVSGLASSPSTTASYVTRSPSTTVTNSGGLYAPCCGITRRLSSGSASCAT